MFEENFETIKFSDLYGYYALSKGESYLGLKIIIQFGFTNSTLLYYTKEPVLWALLKYLYILIGDTKIVFFIIDIIAIFVTFLALKELKQKYSPESKNLNYIFFLIFFTLPFVFGISSIYRQFLSLVFFSAAFAYFVSGKDVKSYFFFGISILTHNGAFLLAPLLFLKKNSIFNFFIVILYFLLLPLILIYLFDTGSRAEISIGKFLEFYYILILFFICSFLFYINKNKNLMEFNFFLKVISFCFLLICFLTFLTESNITDRIFLYITLILVLVSSIVVELVIKNKILGRLLIISIFSLQTIYFQPFF